MKDITTEEAVEKLKDITNHFKNIKTVVDTMEFNTFSMDICEAIEKVLNELKKKDKIIDAMVEQLVGLTIWNNRKDEPLTLMTEEDVKHFFEEEAKDE